MSVTILDSAISPQANTASGAAQSNAAALPATANRTQYLEGFDITGGGATAASVIEISITGLAAGTLFGRPVLISEKVPSLGNQGDVNLLDPTLYVIGDRMQIEVAASEHVNFLKNQMTWRVVERVDGQPWLEKAITLQDGASQVSPFVALN